MRTILLLLPFFLLGFAGSTGYGLWAAASEVSYTSSAAPLAGECLTYLPAQYQCGGGECDFGEYTATAAFSTGEGINQMFYRSAPCSGTGCPSVEQVPTSAL
jgi:hypothetical protein